MGIQVVLAFLVDLVAGDPGWSFHPVRLIGKLTKMLERVLRKKNIGDTIAGILLVVLVAFFCYGITWLILAIMRMIHPLCELLTAVFLIYSSMAFTDLKAHAKDIAYALENGKLEEARIYLAKIVGRDTHNLSREEVVRASVESIAENTVDGIVAPIFYAFIGGAPLAFLYRAINTLDSMVGHKNQEYLHFGWAAAKLDDALNFIPARINAVLVPLISFLVRGSSRDAIVAVVKDGGKHPSPNSGLAEAAFAGALGVQLGGECFYKGERHIRPYLGKDRKQPDIGHIYSSLNLCFLSSTAMIALGLLLSLLLGG